MKVRWILTASSATRESGFAIDVLDDKRIIMNVKEGLAGEIAKISSRFGVHSILDDTSLINKTYR